MGGQPLAEAVAEETAEREVAPAQTQELAHRAYPLERAGEHQLDEDDRIDRGRPTASA